MLGTRQHDLGPGVYVLSQTISLILIDLSINIAEEVNSVTKKTDGKRRLSIRQ
jgi:hypothetical protein